MRHEEHWKFAADITTLPLPNNLDAKAPESGPKVDSDRKSETDPLSITD